MNIVIKGVSVLKIAALPARAAAAAREEEEKESYERIPCITGTTCISEDK